MVKTLTGFITSSGCRAERRGGHTHSHIEEMGRTKGAIQLAKRIYVGGLPYSVTEQDLEHLFAGSGSVTSATVVNDRYTGQSKGFGFVEMSTDGESDKAIQTLNGTMLQGRSLVVNEAKPREDRNSGGGGSYNRGGRY